MRLSLQQAILNAQTHAKNGQVSAAKQIYLSILTKFPNNMPAQLGLAALNKIAEGEGAQPSQDQINAVMALYKQGRFNEVVESAKVLIKNFPQTFLLHVLLGEVHARLGQFKASIDSSSCALAIDPNSVHAHNNLGGALKRTGNITGAIQSYERAVLLAPDNPDLRNNLGIAFAETGEIAAAEKNYQHALKINPDNVKYITSLCDFYEKTNNLSGLSKLLIMSKTKAAYSNSNVLYYAALLDFRKKKFEDAKEIIIRITPDELIPKRLVAFYELKGKVFDKLGFHADAFSAFSKMNAQAEKSPEFELANPDAYFKKIKSLLGDLKNAENTPLNDTPKDDPLANSPCFLVGFPRSGTTLLDTILRSHTKVVVVEEKPMVAAVKNAMDANATLSDFEKFDAKERIFLQSQYYAELDKHIENPISNKTFIDKLPLNALDTPLIRNVFPNAKYILAIRHPNDAILSCYMQYFKLNPQMANLVDMERIVDFYCVTMETWWLSRERYDLDYHMIRYEDLVANMPSEMEKLLQFIGLHWEAGLTDYQKTARERGKINTPSYSQVVQPIYKDATYRWENYHAYFKPYEEKLRPWVERFGYS